MKYLENGVVVAAAVFLGFLLLSGVSLADTSTTVYTEGVENVTYDSAVFVGSLSFEGDEANVSFQYSDTPDNEDDWEYETESKTLNESTDRFTIGDEGLTENTTYAYRAKSEEGENETYGEIEEFTTYAEPSIEATEATEITHNSAVLQGDLVEIGMEEEVKIYFAWQDEFQDGEWNTTDNFTLEEEGVFTREIENLESDREYEFKAVMTWGEENHTVEDTGETFQTETPIYVEAREVEEITTNSALLKGEVLGEEDRLEEEEINASFFVKNGGMEKVEEIEVNSTGMIEAEADDLESGHNYISQIEISGYDSSDETSFLTAPEVDLSNMAVDPEEVYVDEDFEASVDVENLGDVEYEYEVVFSVDGDEEKTVDVNVSGGNTETVTADLSTGSSGTYDVEAEVLGETSETEVEVFNEPDVETGELVEVGEDYAILEGELEEIGLEDEVRVFFRFGDEDEDEDYWGESEKEDVDEEETFEQEVTLDEEIEYGYKAVVQWSDGDEENTGGAMTMAPDACEYSSWENETCGGWDCEDDEVYQVREVTEDSPNFCEEEREKCLEAEDYCGVPNVSLTPEKDIVNVTRGEWETGNVTVENTGTMDLGNVKMDIEAEVPEGWIITTPSTIGVDQKEEKDFQVNFTPSESSPVDKYSLTYTASFENSNESVGGELWIGPDEEGEEKISERYENISGEVSGLEERVKKFAKETKVEEANETLNSALENVEEAKEALNRSDYVTAETKLNKAETLMTDLEEDVKRIEEELAFPWLWVGIGALVIIIGAMLVYLLLPPAEGYQPSKGYQSPSKKSIGEKLKKTGKKIKEKVFGEEGEGYTYEG
ncbi:MAG: hypothetical protein ACLFTQ_03935 [Candidatus Aenigmatarchaeota archaeon]